jgi:hypothetical protein
VAKIQSFNLLDLGESRFRKINIDEVYPEQSVDFAEIEVVAKGRPLLIGSFFFWNSGIEVQRSQVGLLRSLLFEALGSRRRLLPDIFPAEWDSKSDLVAHDLALVPESWTLPRLQLAFKKLVTLASPELKMCFFIDGLDEYHGEPETIAQ